MAAKRCDVHPDTELEPVTGGCTRCDMAAVFEAAARCFESADVDDTAAMPDDGGVPC